MHRINMIERAENHDIDQRNVEDMPPRKHSFAGTELRCISHRVEIGNDHLLVVQNQPFHVGTLFGIKVVLYRMIWLIFLGKDLDNIIVWKPTEKKFMNPAPDC